MALIPRSLPLHLSALLAAAAPVVRARQDVEFTDASQLESLVPGFGSAAPVLGTNVDGGSVLSNFWDAYSDRQFFWRVAGHSQYERPGTDPVDWSAGVWCADLVFASLDDGRLGYTGRCLMITLDEDYQSNAADAGAQLDAPLEYEDMEDIEGFDALDIEDINDLAGGEDAMYEDGGEDLVPVDATFESLALSHPMSVSSSHVPALNAFRVTWHGVTDNYVERALDDGRPRMSASAWEAHDAGDEDPNAASSSFSSVEDVDWMSADEFATLTGIEGRGGEFTPASFAARYNETWTAQYYLYESDDDGGYQDYVEDLIMEESEVYDGEGEAPGGSWSVGPSKTVDEGGEGGTEETNDEVAPDEYASTNGAPGDESGTADASAAEIRSVPSGAGRRRGESLAIALSVGGALLLRISI